MVVVCPSRSRVYRTLPVGFGAIARRIRGMHFRFLLHVTLIAIIGTRRGGVEFEFILAYPCHDDGDER